MSQHTSRRKNYRSSAGSQKRVSNENKSADVNSSSDIIRQFLGYQQMLDYKHDKHECLVKLSRDVTIESKRTIFLLQRTTGSEDPESILTEASTRLADIQAVRWRPIGQELQQEDPYQYIRAYSPGLQEYIEALSFYHYLRHGTLISVEAVQETLVFPADNKQVTVLADEDKIPTCSQLEHPSHHLESNDQSEQAPKDIQPIIVHVPPMEYMLGIADLTGELMRVAIHSVGTGDLNGPFRLLKFLRNIHDSLLVFQSQSRELNRKMTTLKQSLQKVESACYTVRVRGSEIPKHMLADVLKQDYMSRDFNGDENSVLE